MFAQQAGKIIEDENRHELSGVCNNIIIIS